MALFAGSVDRAFGLHGGQCGFHLFQAQLGAGFLGEMRVHLVQQSMGLADHQCQLIFVEQLQRGGHRRLRFAQQGGEQFCFADAGIRMQQVGYQRLAQQLGLPLGDDPVLTTSFALEEPVWTESELYALALESNPDLSFLRSSESAADYDVKIARSSYFPSLMLRTGVAISLTGLYVMLTSTTIRTERVRTGPTELGL